MAEHTATAGAAARRAVATLPAVVSTGAELSSIRTRPVAVDKATAGEFWSALTAPARTARTGGAPRLVSGIDTLWLDAKVHVTLEDSVPQIGAYGPAVRPVVPLSFPAMQPTRTGDTLTRIPELTDSGRLHWQRLGVSTEDADTSSAGVEQDGRTIWSGDALWADVPVNGPDGRYALRPAARRSQSEWTTSTATETVWTFRSTRPATGESAALRLLQIGYGLGVDSTNSVPGGRNHLVTFDVRLPDGSAVATSDLTLRVSTDDGKRWQRVSARPDPGMPGRWIASVRVPHSSTRIPGVSLQVQASDGHGAGIVRTIVRAYSLR